VGALTDTVGRTTRGGGIGGCLRATALVVVLVAGVLLGLLTVPDTAHAAGDGNLSIRLTEAPSARLDDPRAWIYIVDHLAPGATITRHVEVTNDSPVRRRVSLYPGPSRIVDEAWSPQERGATSDLTSWTSLGRHGVRLDPRASVTVPVTIRVPRDASEGERYGVVWAQTASTDPGQVRLVSRVGIRVYLSVGPGGEPVTDFRIDGLTGVRAPDGGLRVLADVTNTGGRALDLEGDLRLSDGPNSLSAGPFPVTRGTTLGPGDRGQVRVDLDETLPLGPWHAALRLRSGDQVRRAEADLSFPVEGIGQRVPVEAGVGAWWPWAAGVALVVLLLALVGRYRRRRRADRPGRHRPGARRLTEQARSRETAPAQSG
jgi:hypothetical protein